MHKLNVFLLYIIGTIIALGLSNRVIAAAPDTLYRKPVTITNSGSLLTNYQVRLVEDTQTLIQQGKMQNSCADMRFVDSDENTELSFWIESGCNTTNTAIWVKLPTIVNGSTTIYMYYGNPSLSSVSSGTATFDFFDDFNSFDSSKWSATGAYTVSNGAITVTTGALYSNNTVSSQPGTITEAKMQWSNYVSGGHSGLSMASTQGTQSGNSGASKLYYTVNNGNLANIVLFFAEGGTTGYRYNSTALFSSVAGTSYVVGGAIGSADLASYKDRASIMSLPGTWTSPYYVYLGYLRGANSGTTNISDIVVDWVIVRKYAANVPTYSVEQESAVLIGAPTSLSASAGNSQVVLNWQAPAGTVNDYKVEYKTSSGSYQEFTHSASNQTSITVTGLTNAITYDFRVAAVNANGIGSYSNIVTAMPVNSNPEAPIATNVNITGGALLTGRYSFSDSNGDSESGSTFRWLRADTSEGVYNPIDGATATTYALQSSDIGKYIKFEVIPKSNVAPSTGSTVLSNFFNIAYLNHILLTGQSFSLGHKGTYALSKTQPYSNLMLNASSSGFIPLAERQDVNRQYLNDINFALESPASAIGNIVTHLSPGQATQTVVTKNGVASAAYSGLKKGTSVYNLALSQISTSLGFANTLSRPYKVIAVANMHGPGDLARADSYRGYLEEWQSDYETDIKSITGQTGTIPMFIDQSSNITGYNLSSHILPIVQLSASESNPTKIFMVGPKYQLTYDPDNIHLINASYRLLGEYFGKVIKKVAIDGESWKPLSPSLITRDRNYIYAQFNVPVSPLVFDTTTVLAQTNYGFEYTDDGTPPVITDVSIQNGNTVKITLASIPTGTNQRLRYAYTGIAGAKPGADSTGSLRGNLRDSDSTTGLSGTPLYNWSVHFDKPITDITDVQSPTISNVNKMVTSTGATITWDTSEASSTRVDYGRTQGMLLTSGELNTSTRVTSHSVELTSLGSCTIYYVVLKSKDTLGNEGTHNTTFTTRGCTGSTDSSNQEIQRVAQSTGGSFSLLDSGKGLSLSIPAYYSASARTFQAHKINLDSVVSSVSRPTGTKRSVGASAFQLNTYDDNDQSVTSFEKPLTMTLSYNEVDLNGANESNLKIYRWDGSTWHALSDCTVDVSVNSVTCTTVSFSTFGIFEEDTTTIPTTTPSISVLGTTSLRVEAPICANSAPGAKTPTLIAAIAEAGNSATLYLTPGDGPYDRYVIRYGIKSGEYIYGVDDIRDVSMAKYTINSLLQGKTYYFQIRAGNGCQPGNWSNEVSVKMPGIFDMASVSQAGSTVALNVQKKTVKSSKQKKLANEKKDTCGQTYIVDKNDTLWSIAKKTLGDGKKYEEIIAKNKKNYPEIEDSIVRTDMNLVIEECEKKAGYVSKTKIKKNNSTIRDSLIDNKLSGKNNKSIIVKILNKLGIPVANAQVTIHSKIQKGTTDKNGELIFNSVEPGNHRILVEVNNQIIEQRVYVPDNVRNMEVGLRVQKNQMPKQTYFALGFVFLGILFLTFRLTRLYLARNEIKHFLD